MTEKLKIHVLMKAHCSTCAVLCSAEVLDPPLSLLQYSYVAAHLPDRGLFGRTRTRAFYDLKDGLVSCEIAPKVG